MGAKAARAAASQADESVEMALLAEFISHDTVASLAAEIAQRLGAKARAQDLIARAVSAQLRRQLCGKRDIQAFR